MIKLEIILLIQKDKYHMISLISVFNTYEAIYETDIESRT